MNCCSGVFCGPWCILLYRYLVCLHDALNLKKNETFSRLYYTLFTVFTKSMFAIGTLKFTIYAPFRRQWLHVHAVRQCLRSTSCSHMEKKMFWRMPITTCHPTGYLRAQVTKNKPRKILLKIQVLQQKMPSTSRWFFLFWYILVII